MKVLGTALLMALSFVAAPQAQAHPLYHRCTPVYRFDEYVIAKPGVSCSLARAVEVNEPGSDTVYYPFGRYMWARRGTTITGGADKGAYATLYWRRYYDSYWPAVIVQTWPYE